MNALRDKFEGYYAPTADQLTELWSEGLIVLDTNALLNLYRYTASTAASFIQTLAKIQARLWLPYQVGLEFHGRRLDVIDQQVQAYEVIARAIDSAKKTLAGEANRFQRHPRIDVSKLLEEYASATANLVENHEASRKEYAKSVSSSPHDDGVLDALTVLFATRVVSRFSDEELAAIYVDGKKRYENSVPPGYKDSRKPEPDRYGDLVIWREMLRKGAEANLPMIFVTDDRKEDWWWDFRGKTVGPRVELVDEYAGASGRRIHFYTPQQFLQYAQGNLAAEVTAESIGEVEAVSQQEIDNRDRALLALDEYHIGQQNRARQNSSLRALESQLSAAAARMARSQAMMTEHPESPDETISDYRMHLATYDMLLYRQSELSAEIAVEEARARQEESDVQLQQLRIRLRELEAETSLRPGLL